MTVRAAGIKLIEPGAAHPAGAETTALTFQKGASVRSSGMDGEEFLTNINTLGAYFRKQSHTGLSDFNTQGD